MDDKEYRITNYVYCKIFILIFERFSNDIASIVFCHPCVLVFREAIYLNILIYFHYRSDLMHTRHFSFVHYTTVIAVFPKRIPYQYPLILFDSII